MKKIRKELGRRSLSLVLAIALIAGMLPAMIPQARAVDAADPADAAEVLENDGIKYYNVHSKNTESAKKLYLDMVTAPNPNLANLSLGDQWLLIAFLLSYNDNDDIFFEDNRGNLYGRIGSSSTPLENIYQYDGYPYYIHTASKNGKITSTRRSEVEKYGKKIYKGSLVFARSSEWVSDSNYANGGYVEEFFSIANYNTDNILAEYQVILSDFKITALLPPDEAGNYVYTTTNTETTGNPTAASVSANNTASPATVTLSTTTTNSVTASSSTTHSSSHSFEESISLAGKWTENLLLSMAELSTTLGFTATQLVEDGWSKETSKSESKDVTYEQQITLEPYTKAYLTQHDASTTITTKYNCCYALNYKVTIKNNYYTSWDKKYGYYSYHSSTNRENTYTFGPNAQADLKERAITDSGVEDKEHINWAYLIDYDDFNVENFSAPGSSSTGRLTVSPAKECATWVPMSPTPATITLNFNSKSMEFDHMAPTLPLKKIRLNAPSVSFISSGDYSNQKYNYQKAAMTVGDSFRANQLELTGLNKENVEYYGFNKANGKWVVADANGNELTGDQPVEVSSDAYGDTIKAVRPGTCFLKYKINEDCYTTAGSSTYTKNSNLDSTAGLEINVTQPAIKLSISGSYTGKTNAEPDRIEATRISEKGKLLWVDAVSYEDGSEGKDLEHSKTLVAGGGYVWEKKQADKKGIYLTLDDDGTPYLEFEATGTFDVRIKAMGKDGTVYYSPYQQITVVEGTNTLPPANHPISKEEVQDIQPDTELHVTGTYEGTVGAKPDPIGVNGRLSVDAIDSTGKEISVRYVWEAKETEGIELTKEGLVTFSKPGTYHVRAGDPTIKNYSEWHTITAKATNHTVTFDTHSDSTIAAAKVAHGECVNRPADPKKTSEEGSTTLYSFDGWYTSSDYTTPYDFSKPVTEDLTLHAKWTEGVRYLLTFHMNDGTGSQGTAYTNKDGKCAVTLKTPSRRGYRFDGWFTEPEGGKQVTQDTVYTQDTNLYAHWKDKSDPTPEPEPEPQPEITYDSLNDAEKKQANAVANAQGVDKDTAAQMVKAAAELGVSLDTLMLSGDALAKMNVDSSAPKGTSFGKLTARVTNRTTNALTLQWAKQKKASGYLIYGNQSGNSNKLKLLATIKNNGTAKWTHKKLKKGTEYKYMVVAYKTVNGKKMPIAASVAVFAPTKGGKNTVAKSVKVNKAKVTVKKGKSVTIKASEVKDEKKKSIKHHRKMMFESSNKSIATVSANGKITGKKKGTCTVYAYGQSGTYKTVKVTVK